MNDTPVGPVDPVDEIAALRTERDLLRQSLEESRHALAEATRRESDVRAALESRVRNVLAVVRSLFSRTVAAGGDLSEIVSHFQGRLDVLSRYQPRAGRRRATSDLETMIWDEFRNFETDARISTSGVEVAVTADVAGALGLAFHELVTNSIKFGALSGAAADARIAIGWHRDVDGLTIRWDETAPLNDGGPADRRGFGREYIENALPYQFELRSTFQLRPDGVLCTIAVPAGRLGVDRDT